MTFLDPTGQGQGAPPEPIVSTPAAAKPKGGGGPFINWRSLTSILSSPLRGTEAVVGAGGKLIESAGKGLLSLPVEMGREGIDQAKLLAHDVTHPSMQSLEAFTGMPLLTHAGVHALPLLGGGKPFPLQPGQTALPDQPTGFGPFLSQVSKEAPASGPLVQSVVGTGQDIEQTARATGNRLLPGQPLGPVGDIGSGPGLLGQTDLAKAAARGGGGVAPRLLSDVTNLSLLGPPVEALVGGAADRAAAEAATHGEALSAAEAAQKEATTAAEANVKQAAQQAADASQALNDARSRAVGGDPTAAAEVATRASAAASANQALDQARAMAAQAAREHGANVDLAQQAADTVQSHADTLKARHETVKLVSKLGSKAAASPFAPVEYGLPIIGKVAHALVGTELGDRYLQPIIDRANAYGEKVQAQREVEAQRSTAQNQAMDFRAEAERGMKATAEPLPKVEGTVKRGPFGLFGTRTVALHDPDAFAMLTMAQTGEGQLLHGLLGEHLGAEGMATIPREEALAHFRDALARSKAGEQYTPEQLDLAAEVFGPGEATGKAQAIREALGPAMAAYARPGGALDVQNREYGQLAGEAGVPNVRPEPGAGAMAQVQHNLEGEGPRIEGLQQWHDAVARYDRAKAQGGRRLERAGKAVTRAVGALDKTGLSADELANPRALFDRLYAAPTATARDVAGRANGWQTLAQMPEKGVAAVAQRVLDGKLASDLAIQPLADQILRLARQNPGRLSDAALALVADARARGMGDLRAAPGNVTTGVSPAVTLGKGIERGSKAVVGRSPELAQDAAARVAGPVGAMYREAGQREGAVTAALSRYRMEQRALDRLDEKLAAKQAELEQSVIAAPRAMRPVLQLGQNLRDVLTPIADAADQAYGAGAGDVYRNAAAEATILSAENMRRYGVDPQFIIGQREAAGGGVLNRERSGGPVVGATGLRKPGIGLRHATDLRTITRQMVGRAEQAIANATADHIIEGRGGTLGSMLEERGVQAVDEMTPAQLNAAMKDAGLTAWRFTDPYGGLEPVRNLDLETKVVPTVVWKAWQRYAEAPSGAIDSFLKRTYDPLTYAMKRIIRITPKWQAAIAAGHSVMAMVGAGADPATYFGHDVPIALRLGKIAHAGEITAEDAAWIKTLPPQVQDALAQRGGFLPGSLTNRGFIHEEFLPTEGKRNLVGGRNLKLATSLDNMHRTAVWIHQLEKGLDARGLSDFRAAFPDLAHLTDSEIQNEAAIRLSIRTMGDYLNKTPAERKVWGRIVYFYPWLRHVTKLALNTAVHEPLRVAWLLHVGAMMDGSGGQAPLDFLSSSFDIGGHRWLTPTAWNPFDAVVPATDNPLGSFNPIINTAVAGLTGHNLRTGKPVTRPSFESGPLSLGETLNFGANQVPLVNPLREAVPAALGQGQPIVRYQTGQPIIVGGRALPSNENQIPGTNTMMPSFLSPLIPYTGLPQQRLINTDEIVARQTAAAAKDERARRSYQRRRALLTGP